MKTLVLSLSTILLISLAPTLSQAQDNQANKEETTTEPFENILYVEIYHGAKGLVLISDGTGSQEVVELLRGNTPEDAKKNNIAIANILNNLSNNGWHLVSTNGDNAITRVFMTRIQ